MNRRRWLALLLAGICLLSSPRFAGARQLKQISLSRPSESESRSHLPLNGTKLDPDWAAFFKKHDFLVGISIDGPREIHDTYRVTRGGRGSFDQVMQGLGSPWRYPRPHPGGLQLYPTGRGTQVFVAACTTV